MANYLKFNRHEIFTSDDRSLVLDVISDVENSNVSNMLFGLFDGYLYDELPSLLEKEDFDTSAILALIEKAKGHAVQPIKENTYNPVQKQKEFDALVNQAVAIRKAMSTTMDSKVFEVMLDYSNTLIYKAETINEDYLEGHTGYLANKRAIIDDFDMITIPEKF